MLKTSAEEATAGFAAAKNLNAALKNFLKKEVGSNDAAARFAKDFRGVVSTGRPALVQAFIQKNIANHSLLLFYIAHHAHADAIDPTVGEIHDQYGDEFNASYKSGEQSITVTDTACFTRIVKEVAVKVDEILSKAALPVNNFMRNAVLVTIFEQNVLVEAIPIMEG